MTQFLFSFEVSGPNSAVRNRSTAELEKQIREVSIKYGMASEVITRVDKNEISAMDFGATLVAFLGAPAIAIIAKAVADHIKKKEQSIIVKYKDRSVEIRGKSAENISRELIEKILLEMIKDAESGQG